MSKSTVSREEVVNVLKKVAGNLTRAGRILGVRRETVRNYIYNYKIVPDDFGGQSGADDQIGSAASCAPNRVLKAQYDSALKELGLLKGASSAVLSPPKWVLPASHAKSRRIDCSILSDVHDSEVVDPKSIEWINCYNSSIAESRLKIWAEHTIRLSRDYSAGTICDGIVVPILGDIVSGIIHDELAKTNDQQILATVVHAADNIAAALDMFADYYGHVYVPCVVGNHGRLTPMVSFKGAVQDNFDWLVYSMIARHYAKSKNVTVTVATSPEYDFNIYKTSFRISHGHEFRGGSGIIGGIYPILRGNKRKLERQTIIGRAYTHLIIGHWHKAIPLVDGVVCNGAMKGYDEYAYNLGCAPTPPEQVFFSVDPRYGITISAKVRCICNEGEPWMKEAPEHVTPRWMITD
jgi:hypothetical protein